MLMNVLDYVENAAGKHPDKIAFIEGENTVTFEEFRQLVLARAFGILCRLNQKQAEHRPIVLMQQKGIDELVNFMAVAYTGNIYVPFDTESPDERLKKMLNVLNPVLIITDDQSIEKTQRLGYSAENIVVSKELDCEKTVDQELLVQIRKGIVDTDPLYIICTSGSTGIPKGVVVSHRSVIDFTEEVSERMQFSSSEKFVSQVPFYFDVSILDIYCTLRNIAELHIVPKQYYMFPIKVAKYIQENQINAVIWVPSVLVMMANLRILNKIDMTSLNKVMFCGEVMPNKQLNVWRRAIPCAQYINCYGPTETVCASTYYMVDRLFADDEPLPIGKPANNTRILVLNEENQLVKKGEIGELCIAGSSLALGYYGEMEKTKEVFIQNPLNQCYKETIYRTGDLVQVNEYDELMYKGRKDFQIKHRGYRIELGEIETAVSGIKGIHMNCCLYDAECNSIILFYEGELEERGLTEILREKIPHYMIPQTTIKMENMPLNANGKIDREKLRNYVFK